MGYGINDKERAETVATASPSSPNLGFATPTQFWNSPEGSMFSGIQRALDRENIPLANAYTAALGIMGGRQNVLSSEDAAIKKQGIAAQPEMAKVGFMRDIYKGAIPTAPGVPVDTSTPNMERETHEETIMKNFDREWAKTWKSIGGR